jgi:hypothetical protein
MMNKSILLICSIILCNLLFAQKKVDAQVNLVDQSTDSVTIQKGKSFVVMLPVHNRIGDDWKLSPVPAKLKFTESYLGEAGMLPNQQEPKLFFFKAQEKGVDSVRFEYKNPKALPNDLPEYRKVLVKIL